MNSHKLELTGEDLCRHSLLLGTTGSGKSTILNTFLRDLIAYGAKDPNRRVGMLIFDFKADDTVTKMRHWAREAGRESDVQELSPNGDFYYDFVSDGLTLDQIDELVEKMASAAPLTNPHDSFWWQIRDNLLDAALTILRVTCEKMDFRTAMEFMGRWLLNPCGSSSVTDKRVQDFDRIIQGIYEELDLKWKNKLDGVRAVSRMWQSLDSRTKSSAAAVLSNCLKPLLGLKAQKYFEAEGRRPLHVGDIIEHGKIIIISVNAAANPGLAQLIGKLIKADFYRCVQERRLSYEDLGRLVGMVMDEYQLVATADEGSWGDIPQLGTLRSKRAFVIAATQGFVSLDMVIGEGARDSLVVNFNNLLLFNSHEAALDRFAQIHFGVAPQSFRARLQIGDSQDNGDLKVQERQLLHAQVDDWVCPPGRLSRLETNQAYVSLARGRKYLDPLWIEPLYFTVPIATKAIEECAPDKALGVLARGRAKLQEQKEKEERERARVLEEIKAHAKALEGMEQQAVNQAPSTQTPGSQAEPKEPPHPKSPKNAKTIGTRLSKKVVKKRMQPVSSPEGEEMLPRSSQPSPAEIYQFFSSMEQDGLEALAFDAIRWLDSAETREQAEQFVVKVAPFFLDCTFPRLREELKQALRDTLDRAEQRFGSLAEVLGLGEAERADED